jgi:hypothetical protein
VYPGFRTKVTGEFAITAPAESFTTNLKLSVEPTWAITFVKFTPGVKYLTKLATSAFAALFSRDQANPEELALSHRTEVFPAADEGCRKIKLIAMSDIPVITDMSFFISDSLLES